MIKVGIIGMGRSGWELHAAPLMKFPGYCLVRVCDPSNERMKKAAQEFGVKTCTDAQALFDDPEVELVVVSAPSNLHAELTIAALEAGKHVIVEKPMALTLADADRMIAAAEKCHRVLTVFHNRRWDRDFQMLKKIVQQDVLGEMLTLDSRVMTFGPEWTSYGVSEFNPQWRIQKTHGGGFLADWGPHLVEQCLDLTGAWPASVSCQLRSQLWAQEVEDYFHIRLTFPSGLVATLEGSNNARLPLPRWFIAGRKATLVADGTWGKWTDMKIRSSVAGMVADLLPQDAGPSSGNRNYDVGEELSACFYGDLAEALKTGAPPAITTRRAREVMMVLEEARNSHLNGTTIQL
jgi:scyllo-inositol 2-dehydrogenase (NADP+)